MRRTNRSAYECEKNILEFESQKYLSGEKSLKPFLLCIFYFLFWNNTFLFIGYQCEKNILNLESQKYQSGEKSLKPFLLCILFFQFWNHTYVYLFRLLIAVSLVFFCSMLPLYVFTLCISLIDVQVKHNRVTVCVLFQIIRYINIIHFWEFLY